MKSKLITAALVSLLAFASLPALSQTEVDGVPVLTPIHTTVETTTTVEPLYPMNDEDSPVIEQTTTIKRTETVTPAPPPIYNVEMLTPLDNSTRVEITTPVLTVPDNSTPMDRTDLYTPLEETTPVTPSQTSMQPVDVTTVKPFSPEANYMSRAGFLRAETYANTGVWMDHDEAVAAVDSQMESATR